jgi:trans-aconitate methyltransferase
MSERTEQLRKEWGERSGRLGFTQRAVLFKRFPGWLNDSIHRRHIRFVADSVPANTRHILDVGCGYGRISAELQSGLPDAQFEGIDLCTEFAEQFEQCIGHCFNGPVQEYRPDKEFELIIIVTTLMYLTVDEQGGVLARLWDSLAPGGRMVAIEPASELFYLWRRLTGRESASPTGGTVEHFQRQELADSLAALDGAKIISSKSVKVVPFVSASAVHHCVAAEKPLADA